MLVYALFSKKKLWLENYVARIGVVHIKITEILQNLPTNGLRSLYYGIRDTL
jgi:hypothetical protein